MDEHECYIGLLYKDERNDLVALDDLKEYIEDNKKKRRVVLCKLWAVTLWPCARMDTKRLCRWTKRTQFNEI